MTHSSVIGGAAVRVAVLTAAAVALGSCRPKVVPEGPGADPAPYDGVASVRPERSGPPPARQVLVGEMCPQGAGGRPAVVPMFMRGIGWLSSTEEVERPIETHAARQFSVFGWDGRRVGIFSVAGITELGPGVGIDRSVALGGYAGVSPCVGPEPKEGERETYEACLASQAHCGVALAVLEAPGGHDARPFAEDPDPAVFSIGTTCVADGKLVVDLEGDGRNEVFPVDGFLDPVRGPADEVVAAGTRPSCEPSSFAFRHAIPAGDPRHWRGLDVLGVVDIDDDGRREIIVSYHYSDRRTWAVYSATATPARLDLVGESVPWPRP